MLIYNTDNAVFLRISLDLHKLKQRQTIVILYVTLRSFSPQALNVIILLTGSESNNTTKHGEKRQMMWDWKQGRQNKKAKVDVPVEKGKKVAQTFHCLECLELALQGKMSLK